MNTQLYLPLLWTRLTAYGLATLVSIIAGAASVNVFEKFHSQKTMLKRGFGANTVVHVDVSDVEDAGIILFIVVTFLSMQVGNFILMLLKDRWRPFWPPAYVHPKNGIAFSTRTMKFQAWYMLVNTAVILAALVPTALFAARRGPMLTAFQGGSQLPDAMVKAQAAALGYPITYWSFFPVRFQVVSNCINVLSSIIATVVSFVALQKYSKGSNTGGQVLSPGNSAMDVTEKTITEDVVPLDGSREV